MKKGRRSFINNQGNYTSIMKYSYRKKQIVKRPCGAT